MSATDFEIFETPQEFFPISDELSERARAYVRETKDMWSNPKAQRNDSDLRWMCEQVCDLLVKGIEPYGDPDDDEWRGSFSPDLYHEIQAFLETAKNQLEARKKPAKEGIATLKALDDAYIKSRTSGVAARLLDRGGSQSVPATTSTGSWRRSWKTRLSAFFSSVVSWQ
jgi:hypothetical protein